MHGGIKAAFSGLALTMLVACGGGDGGSGGGQPAPPPPPPPPPPAPPAIQSTGTPVETRPANAEGQIPAFAGQTRVGGQRTVRALVSTVVASGLVEPWALEALPDGRWLISERPGRLRVVTAAGVVGPPIAGLPAVAAEGQGGLLDLALSPTFGADRLVYWTYAEPRTGGSGTSVARGRLAADGLSLSDVQVIFRALPTYAGAFHYGSRLAVDASGRLHVSLGDRGETALRPFAQRLESHYGKVVRINADGTVPGDNPFVGQAGARPEIWSRGHRNPQGLTLDPTTGMIWGSEHGTAGGDEINLIRGGRNYGWPEVTYGEEYAGAPIGAGVTARADVDQPVYYWDPSIAPAGLVFYYGAMFPEWRGHLLVAALTGRHLIRLQLSGDRVIGEERLLVPLAERIRDVAVAADGAVWVVTAETNGKLVRLSAG